MLGSSEDLAAVLAVLDRLSNELGSNRRALDSTCETADEVSGGSSLTTDYTGDCSIDELKRHIEQEQHDCEYLRNALETTMSFTSKAWQLMQEINHAQAVEELEVQKGASQELLSWQIRVENAAEQYHALEIQNLAVNDKLVKLYKLLQSRSQD